MNWMYSKTTKQQRTKSEWVWILFKVYKSVDCQILEQRPWKYIIYVTTGVLLLSILVIMVLYMMKIGCFQSHREQSFITIPFISTMNNEHSKEQSSVSLSLTDLKSMDVWLLLFFALLVFVCLLMFCVHFQVVVLFICWYITQLDANSWVDDKWFAS